MCKQDRSRNSSMRQRQDLHQKATAVRGQMIMAANAAKTNTGAKF
jgi:hypothetical protein